MFTSNFFFNFFWGGVEFFDFVITSGSKFFENFKGKKIKKKKNPPNPNPG
jgi:hypothetical protein